MVDLLYCLTNLLFFDIPLFYYFNLSSSIITCLFSADTFVILLAKLLLTRSPVASAVS